MAIEIRQTYYTEKDADGKVVKKPQYPITHVDAIVVDDNGKKFGEETEKIKTDVSELSRQVDALTEDLFGEKPISKTYTNNGTTFIRNSFTVKPNQEYILTTNEWGIPQDIAFGSFALVVQDGGAGSESENPILAAVQARYGSNVPKTITIKSSTTGNIWISTRGVEGTIATYTLEIGDNEVGIVEQIKNKTEKVRIDIIGQTGNYQFKKDNTVLNFQDLNNILQNSPDFAVFVHGNREHRCTMIDMDSNPKQMRFVAPILSEGVLKTQSFYITSNNGVDITSITSSNINCENSSNKVSTLDNANNTTYPTTKAVKDKLDKLFIEGGKEEMTKNPTSLVEGYWQRIANGTLFYTASSSFWSFNPIDISKAIVGEDITVTKVTVNSNCGVFLFDDDNKVIAYINGTNASEHGISPSATPQVVNIKMVEGAKYIVFDFRSTFFTDFNNFSVTYQTEIQGVNESINEIRSEVEEANNTADDALYKVQNVEGRLNEEKEISSWVNGFYNESGGIGTSSSWERLEIDVTHALYATIKSAPNGTASFAFLDNSHGDHLITWNNEIIDTTIDLSKYEDATTLKLSNRKTYTTREVKITENKILVRDDLSELENQIKFIRNVANSDIGTNVLHFSFDDTCTCLKDITVNANSYNSIFDNIFFKALKDLHDEHGMCFTLNTFNTIKTNKDGYYPAPNTYNINSLTTKFRGEFSENKSWLKFAFHAEDETSNYNTTELGDSYDNFVAGIYNLTGDYECIDRFTRLGFFGGNLANVKKMKDTNHGIIGLFSADDTRAYDYYLSEGDIEALRRKGKFYDEKNGLIFIKTQNRDYGTGMSNVDKTPMFQKITEFFTHEYAYYREDVDLIRKMKAELSNIAQWAKNKGYTFYFISDLYR